MKPTKARRILVFQVGQLGDTVVSLPAMWAVRKHFPEAHIAVLSDRHPGTGYVLTRSVLPKKGLFDQYFSYDANRGGIGPSQLWSILPKLRQGRFHTLVYLAARLRTRWQVWRDIMFFRLGGVTQFIGHRGFEPLPKHAEPPLSHLEHVADRVLKRLELSGLPVPPPGHGCMDLHLSAPELAEAQGWLEAQLSSGLRGSLIGFGPGSKMPSKVWPEDRYAALGRHLIDELGVFPVVFGGPEDRVIGDRLIDEWGVGANAAGELNVRQAAAALSSCRLYVGNDTGTMHLAAAVGTRCVAIFSARDWPGRWYPYGEGHVVLRRRVPCEGCRLTTCIEHDQLCLKRIPIAEVVKACDTVLRDMGLSHRSLQSFGYRA